MEKTGRNKGRGLWRNYHLELFVNFTFPFPWSNRNIFFRCLRCCTVPESAAKELRTISSPSESFVCLRQSWKSITPTMTGTRAQWTRFLYRYCQLIWVWFVFCKISKSVIERPLGLPFKGNLEIDIVLCYFWLISHSFLVFGPKLKGLDIGL